MPSYYYGHPRLERKWRMAIRDINRRFKELEQEYSAPRIRLKESEDKA